MEIGELWVTDNDAERLRRALRRRKLILASASPRRAKVLTECGVKFTVSPVEVGEHIGAGSSPSGHVVGWSKRKALAAGQIHPRGLILGVDTIVHYRGKIFGKPGDKQDARRLLTLLSGRTHTVYTGMALVAMPQRVLVSGWCTTRVRFFRLSRRQIDAYIATGEPMDKAGAYGIQEGGRRLVADIDGPLDNVVGLPVGRFAGLIERLKGRLSA